MGLFSSIKHALGSAVHAIGGAVKKAVHAVKSVVKPIAHAVGHAAKAVVNKVIKPVFNKVIKPVAKATVSAVKSGGKLVGKVATTAVNRIDNTMTFLSNPLVLIGGGVVALMVLSRV